MPAVAIRGSVSRAIDSLSRAADGFFRDPVTGDVVLGAKPTAQMKALGAVLAASRALHGGHVVETGDPLDVFLERAAMGLLMWWSIHQIRHGTTEYLKTIGTVTVVGATARTILAHPKYGLSPEAHRAPRRMAG